MHQDDSRGRDQVLQRQQRQQQKEEERLLLSLQNLQRQARGKPQRKPLVPSQDTTTNSTLPQDKEPPKCSCSLQHILDYLDPHMDQSSSMCSISLGAELDPPPHEISILVTHPHNDTKDDCSATSSVTLENEHENQNENNKTSKESRQPCSSSDRIFRVDSLLFRSW